MCFYLGCLCNMRGDLLPDFHGTLIVRLEEIIRAVVLDCFSAVLSYIEDCNTHEKDKQV